MQFLAQQHDCNVHVPGLFQPSPNSIPVVDPKLKQFGRLWIGKNVVEYTKAVERWMSEDPRQSSLCLLFSKGECNAGDKCNQLHVDPAYTHAMREILSPLPVNNCCFAHGDVPSLREDFQALLKSRPLELSPDGGKGISVPSHYIAVTAFWEQHLQDKNQPAGPMRINPGRVCRLHQRDACKFGADCNNMHICREFFSCLPMSHQSLQRKAPSHLSPACLSHDSSPTHEPHIATPPFLAPADPLPHHAPFPRTQPHSQKTLLSPRQAHVASPHQVKPASPPYPTKAAPAPSRQEAPSPPAFANRAYSAKEAIYEQMSPLSLPGSALFPSPEPAYSGPSPSHFPREPCYFPSTSPPRPASPAEPTTPILLQLQPQLQPHPSLPLQEQLHLQSSPKKPQPIHPPSPSHGQANQPQRLFPSAFAAPTQAISTEKYLKFLMYTRKEEQDRQRITMSARQVDDDLFAGPPSLLEQKAMLEKLPYCLLQALDDDFGADARR